MDGQNEVSRRAFVGMAAAIGTSFSSIPGLRDNASQEVAAGEANTPDGSTEDRATVDIARQCVGGGRYVSGTPMPAVEIGNNAGALVDGVLYSIGGILDDVGDERSLQATDTVMAYDTTADSWDTDVPDLPRELWGMDAIGADGEVYAWGGAKAGAPFGAGKDTPEYMSERIYRLVPGDGWEELDATVPGGVLMESRSLYNPHDGLVYVFGGATSASNNTDRIWTFDPETESVVDAEWQTLPEASRWPSVGLVEVDATWYAHCLGGIAYDDDGHYAVDTNTRYNLATGDRERMNSLPTGVARATGHDPVLDNVIYLLDGAQATAYDPEADAFFDVQSIDEGLSFGAHGVHDDELVVLGGHDKIEEGEHEGAHDTTDRVWRYTPPC